MVICCSFPVPKILCGYILIPFASISKVTSICGTPLLAGGIPSRRNWPRVLLSLANCLSPCTTWMSTAVWLSAAVEKIWLFLVGIVVFLDQLCSGFLTMVSIDRDSGVTSRRVSPAPASPPAFRPGLPHRWQRTHPGLRSCLAHGLLPLAPSR